MKFVSKEEVLEVNQAVAVLQRLVGDKEFFMKLRPGTAVITIPAIQFNFTYMGESLYQMTTIIHHDAKGKHGEKL